MKFLHTEGNFQGEKGDHNFKVPIFSFIEDGGTHIIYAPSLDISGYGNSDREAHESFHFALEEFLKYTENKNTLDGVLTGLGWTIKLKSKKRVKYEAPSLTDLLCRDEYLDQIFTSKDFNKSSTEIALPA